MSKIAGMSRALLLLLSLIVMPAARARAGGVGVSEPPDSIVTADTTLGTSSGNSHKITIRNVPFHLYQPRADRSARGRRDLSILWSDTYRSHFRMPLDSLSGPEQINDLQRLAEGMCEHPGVNALGLPFTNIQLIYNFLRTEHAFRDAYSLYKENPALEAGLLVAQETYPVAEANHLDAYVYAPSLGPLGGWSAYAGDGVSGSNALKNYGQYPSEFWWPAEDSLTGHLGEQFSDNSIMIPGPHPSKVADLGPSKWTRQRGPGIAGLAHEGLHAINADATGSAPHLFASGAEVLVGVGTDAPRFDVDYHYSLSPTSRNTSNAYPHWLSFAAYLAYNWRGSDTSATASGWQDDLLPRWARGVKEERWLTTLPDRLRDEECGECAVYPGFAGLGRVARLARLLHDWRVANYVNNPSLPGGRYGYPPQFGFNPADQLGAWQDIDTSPAATNSVSIPPVIPVGPSPALRAQWFAERPGGPGFGPRPLEMEMFGAEYFIFKADPALQSSPQRLIVRVRGEMMGTMKIDAPGEPTGCGPDTLEFFTGTLTASVVTYSNDSDSLFRHPEWAQGVTTKALELGAPVEDLEFEIPDFGGATKAIVLVVTFGDGGAGGFSNPEKDNVSPGTLNLQFGVALQDIATPVVPRALANTGTAETSATWSPDGTRLAYCREEAGVSRIYVRNVDGIGPATPLRSPSASQTDPAWSPRGDKIAYVEGDTTTRIWFVNIGSGTTQQVFSMDGRFHEPAWSPDGGRLAYFREWTPAVGDTAPQEPPHEGDLGASPALAKVEDLLVRDLVHGVDSLVARFIHPAVDSPNELSGLRWTTDSRLLTFSRFDPDSGRHRTCQVDLRTRSLTFEDDKAPRASVRELAPGEGPILVAERVLFPLPIQCTPTAQVNCHLCGPEQGDIFDTTLVASDRIALRDTTTGTSWPLGYRRGGVFTDPRWSPDGTRVAYTTTQNGNPDVYVIATTLDKAPILSSLVQPAYTTYNCTPFELSLAATDPDGDPVTFRAHGLPPGASLQNGFRVYWPAPVVGQHWFTVQALDPTGAVATRLIQLDVYDGGGCGGGGGGEGEGEILPGGGHAAREAGTSRAIGSTQPIPRAVNSFLDGAAPGQWVEQSARLLAARTEESGRVTAQLVGLRAGEFRLDRVRLLVVDHDPALVPVATDSGVALGARCKPTSVEVAGGSGVTEGLVAAGTTLTVAWSGADSLAGLLLDCARAGAVDTLADWGVQVEIRDGEGWVAHRRVRPRSGHDQLAVPLGGVGEVRLRFMSDVYVRELTGYSLAGAQAAAVLRLPCTTASLDGGIANLAEADEAAVALGRGQRVSLSFDAPPAVETLHRSLFMELVASFTPADPGAAQARASGTEPAGRFALHAGVPNPFERTTDIRFEVARASRVRVEVFDAQGRRVRTLAEREFAPGVHLLVWDGSATGGRSLGPGVYLVRMTAGAFRAERRVVRLGH